MWFTYSPDRKGEHPQRHLASFHGILQADAYAGFNKLYEDGSIQQAPCMAHIRRKFYGLMEAHHSPIATEAVERIAPLYAIEKEIRGRSPDERREVRNARARPLIESMRKWLEMSLTKLSRKSETAAAIHYALARWDALARYLDDGRIEIDNPAAERALRAVAVGRRNYLFAGSDRGGERAAVFYSLIGSAKLTGYSVRPKRGIKTRSDRSLVRLLALRKRKRLQGYGRLPRGGQRDCCCLQLRGSAISRAA